MLVPAVFFLLTFNIVAAQVVTRCEEASGHAFYFGGWDGIKELFLAMNCYLPTPEENLTSYTKMLREL